MEAPEIIVNPLCLLFPNKSDGESDHNNDGFEGRGGGGGAAGGLDDDGINDGASSSLATTTTSSYNSKQDEEEWLRCLDREMRNIQTLEQMKVFIAGHIQGGEQRRLDLEPLMGGLDTRERQAMFIEMLHYHKVAIQSVQIPLSMATTTNNKKFVFLDHLWLFLQASLTLKVCGIVGGILDNAAIQFMRQCLNSFAHNPNGLPKQIIFTKIHSHNSSLDDPSWYAIAQAVADFDTLQKLQCRLCPGRLLWWILNGLASNKSIQAVTMSPGMDWSSHMDVCWSMKTFIRSSQTLQRWNCNKSPWWDSSVWLSPLHTVELCTKYTCQCAL